jgi:hypothetical protein
VDSCVHSNELSGSMKGREFDLLSDSFSRSTLIYGVGSLGFIFVKSRAVRKFSSV